MAYIPKSQIKENQFAQGSEWYYVKDGTNYIGFYYTLSNGTSYTGKNPNDPPNEEIENKTSTLFSPNTTGGNDGFEGVYAIDNWDGNTYGDNKQSSLDIAIYGVLNKTNFKIEKSIPQYNITYPTAEDYEKGVFVKYFVCRINQLEYIEIDKETYTNINTKNNMWQWENYIPFTLNWYIKGDIDRVFNNNKGLIFIKEKEIKRKGLDNYLEKNYLQYFEYSENNNLNAKAGELITAMGKDYIGPYHIHKSQGPMEGPNHIKGPHKKLFYKRFYRGKIVDSLNQEGVIETGETQRIEYASDLTVEYDPPSPSSPSTGGGY